MNATITAGDVSVSPFSQVILKDLKVQTTGTEPLLAAAEVRLRYHLMSIIRGNILVDEVTVASPTVTLVNNPDGTSNLDPILKSQQQQQPSKAKESKPSSKPAQIDVKLVKLSNGTVRQIKLYAGGKRDVTEVANLNVELANLKNGQTGKLSFGADLRMENNSPAPQTNGLLQAKVNGSFDLGLSADLKPSSIQGNTKVEVTRAEGAFAQAGALGLNLDCQVSPTEIKQVALVLQRSGTPLGQILVSGPFDMEKTEGRLTVQVLNIDKNLLNVAGAMAGLDFGGTKVNSTNLVALAKGGQSIAVTGQFNLNSLEVTRTNQTTPPLDLRADYDLTLDRAASNALVRVFNLSGVQKGNQFLKGELSRPMTVSWGNVSNAVESSALNVSITHLDLANWKAFVGDVAPAGDVNGKLQLTSEQGGNQLTFDLDSELANLVAVMGSNQIRGVTVGLRARGQAANLEQFNLANYGLQISRQNQSLASVSGSGTYNQKTQAADMQVEGQAVLPRLVELLPQPDLNISSGTAQFKAHITQSDTNHQAVVGNFALADFTAQVGSNSFRAFGTTADFAIARTPEQITIRKCAGKLTEGGSPGGSFDLTATYRTNKAAQLNATLANFNQAGLRAFLEPMLGNRKLVTVALNGTASAQYDPQGASSVKAELQVTNLVVNDPAGQIPPKPLEARMNVDASLNKQVADIRQFAIGLTPTPRATNRVTLTGQVDMTRSNNIEGNLKLAADSLDLTTYYDLFASKTSTSPSQPGAQPAQPAPATAPPPGPEKEPEPVSVPLTNFTAEANIGTLFLREVAVSNLQMVVKINGPRILIDPFKLSLNGAPVGSTVDLDLGVPGYKYNVAASGRAIPLAPLVNTFQPERKGILGGTMTAEMKIAGAGTTGASLQKSLAGNFDIGSTNLNLNVDNISNKGFARLLKPIVNAIILIPDLAKNPSAGLTGFATSLLSGSSPNKAGATNDIGKSPIDSIILRGVMGGGQVQIQQGAIVSPAFRADAVGKVVLAQVLTNSAIDIPVSVALERAVAQRINMVPANAATNDVYVKLPQFLAEKGTLGDPKVDINKLALLGGVLQGASGLAGKNSGLLQGLGSVLGGGSGGATGTNANTNTTSKSGGLLQGLGGILGGGAPSTNVPTATNAPATNQTPVGNLLNNLFGPKKK